MTAVGNGPRALLVDGDLEPELTRRGIHARPTPGAAPPPVREPEAVRKLLVEIVKAGADVLTAPTARTHRRALARLGEARRAREWTLAVVSLAREAAQMAADALDEEATRAAPLNGSLVRTGPPRVAGLLAPLEDPDAPEAAPDETTALAEHRGQAGLLADAGVDLLRIDGMGTVREAHAATLAATEHGIEAWSGAAIDASGTRLLSGEPLDAWLEAILPLAPAALVVEGPTAQAVELALRRLRAWGATVLGASLAADLPADAYAGDVERWLETGAGIVGCGRDAHPARLMACRSALDRWTARRREAEEGRRAAWANWLGQGARRAGAGAAVAVLRPGSGALPTDVLPESGPLAWRVVTPEDLAWLPAARFALAVADADELGQKDLARLVSALVPGGWLLLAGRAPEPPWVSWLVADGRIEMLQPTADPPGVDLRGWLGRRRP